MAVVSKVACFGLSMTIIINLYTG